MPSPITVSRKDLRSIVVPAPTSTSFWISTRPVCGTFRWPVGAEEDEAVAVLADRLQPGWIRTLLPIRANWIAVLGADIAVAADLDAGADHGAGADHRARADLDLRTDHDQRIDDDAVLEPRGRIDDRRRRDALGAEPGLRPQRVGVPFPRDLDEGAGTAWPPAAPPHAPGTCASKRGLTRQAPAVVAASWSAYLRLSKNGEMHRTGLVERGQAPDLMRAPCGVDQLRLRQRGNVSQR